MRRRLVRSPAHPLYSGEKAARGKAIGPVPGSENPPPKERDFGNEQAYFQAQDRWLGLWTTVVLPTVSSAQPSALRGRYGEAREMRMKKWKTWASKHPLYDGKGEAPRSKSPVARTPPAAAWTPIIDLDIGSGARDGSSVGGDRGRRQPLVELPRSAAEPSGSGSVSSQPGAVSPLISSSALEGTVRVDGELCGGLTWPGGWVGQGLADWAIERWCAGAEHSSQHWRCGHEWLEAPGEIVGGGDTPCERALFRLFDAVEGLLDGEKRLFEPGDPVGDRLLCDACRVWSPMVRDLSEGVDGFADFREAYRLFRDS